MNDAGTSGVHKHIKLKDSNQASNLLAILNSANELLEMETENIPFQEYLNQISPVTSANRTYIFLNHFGATGEKVMSYMAEWCDKKTESEIDNPLLQNISYDKFFPSWYDIFSERKLIFGPISSFPEKEKTLLEKRGVKSLLMAPFFCSEEFTGFIGFDNCASEDEWSNHDFEFIKAAASNLSNRIEKNWVLTRVQKQNNLFTAVMDAMDVIVYAVDYNTFEVVYMNEYAIQKFGDGLGRKCWNVFHDDKKIPCTYCSKEKLVEDDGTFNEPHIWENYYPKINQWCITSSQALKWPDGRTVIFQISSNITKHKKTEALLEKSIEEKDSLLNEVHHRVKNNLQSLVYLICMQKDSVNSPNAHEVLNDLQERVQAMSLVHSQLYQSKNLSRINFKKYVSELINSLFKAINTKEIQTFIDISDIYLDIKSAIPCGLIVNELVTNIIKHAFKDKKSPTLKPEIQISMQKVKDQFVLKIGDNGTGFRTKVDFKKTKSLGLKLVDIWATHQLRGTLETDDDSGCEFKITFPQK